jgi:hypothetical protein
MCYHTIDLYLHCSHITIRPSYCASNLLVETTFGSRGAGSHASNHHQPLASSYQSISLVERCLNHTSLETHSYLLCCPSCRGGFEHAKYELKKKCLTTDTKATTLPTCARLKMKAKATPQLQPPAVFHEQPASAFPYGFGLNVDMQNDRHNLEHTNGSSNSTALANNASPQFEIVETYLRFPLTKCHHLIPFSMPETFLDKSSDNVWPCGCWTGKAPDAQMQEAALFIEYVGAEGSFKSVWDVTGLGTGGCWECGALEFEVGDGGDAGDTAVENGDRLGYLNGAHHAEGIQRVNKETGEVWNIKEAFLKDCEQWQRMENWKDEWWSGDMVVRGAGGRYGTRTGN